MAKTLDEMIQQANDTRVQIEKNMDLDKSIIALVQAQSETLKELRAQLDAAGTDPAKLAELGDAMEALAAKAAEEGQASADAVKANTPAA